MYHFTSVAWDMVTLAPAAAVIMRPPPPVDESVTDIYDIRIMKKRLMD